MAYKVIHPATGIEVLCDTPQQVSELLAEFSKTASHRASGTVPAPAAVHSAKYAAMIHGAEDYAGISLPLRVPGASGAAVAGSIPTAVGTTTRSLPENLRKVADALIARAGTNISSEALSGILGSSSVEGIGPSLRWKKPLFTAVGIDLDQILARAHGLPATWEIRPSPELRKLQQLMEGSS